MSDADRDKGLYDKYYVTRRDGSSAYGGKHHGCEYFVLDLTHDEHAIPALRAYAFSCKETFPRLAEDLRAKVDQMTSRPRQRITLDQVTNGSRWHVKSTKHEAEVIWLDGDQWILLGDNGAPRLAYSFAELGERVTVVTQEQLRKRLDENGWEPMIEEEKNENVAEAQKITEHARRQRILSLDAGEELDQAFRVEFKTSDLPWSRDEALRSSIVVLVESHRLEKAFITQVIRIAAKRFGDPPGSYMFLESMRLSVRDLAVCALAARWGTEVLVDAR